jgi:hypothetical protein
MSQLSPLSLSLTHLIFRGLGQDSTAPLGNKRILPIRVFKP